MLPSEAPDTGDWTNGTGFQFRYDVLPDSVISRFIVRMHNRISQRTYWRKGVVLASQDGRNRALVRADYEDLQIDIRVSGPVDGRRMLLGSIRDQFAEIHATIPKLHVREFVPLPDYQGVSVSYQRLVDLNERNRRTDYVEEIRDDINVRDLLGAVGTSELQAASTRGEEAMATQRGKATTEKVRSVEGFFGSVAGWRWFSVACGGAAMVVALIILLIPTPRGKAVFGGLVGLGTLVSAFVMSLNPASFYRRMLRTVIVAGLLANGVGFTVDAIYWGGK